MQAFLIQAMEKGWIPDWGIRVGIRALCKERIASLQDANESSYAEALRNQPIAISTQAANDQHYELPASFFEIVLGKNRKYSSAFFDANTETLDQAEDLALRTTMERAELSDGMKILELGCGWGSLTLAMARAYPNAQITALSNSVSQRLEILKRAKAENLRNIQVITGNIAEIQDLGPGLADFDRVVSVEMFEHMKNYELLLQKISRWLKPDGKLFVHIFTHRSHSYPFEVEGEDNWMGRYFFTGGQMPSQTLLSQFQKDLTLEQTWQWSGEHYSKTSEAWLDLMDQNRDKIIPIMAQTYGPNQASIWFQRWRVFFMSCAELFGFDHGKEWGVTHYRFKNKGNSV